MTLATKSSVKFDGEKIQVDPQLLFQRPIVALKSLHDMEAIFKLALCSYPPALFDSSLMLLQPHKPALADTIWAMTMESSDITAPQGELQFVLDGVALFTESIGCEGVPEIYVRCTAIMWTRSMEKQ